MCARTNLRGRAYCLATVAVGLLNERVFLLIWRGEKTAALLPKCTKCSRCSRFEAFSESLEKTLRRIALPNARNGIGTFHLSWLTI